MPGGGDALIRCIAILDGVNTTNEDQKRGVDIVRQAIRMPCWQIASNAGVDASVIVNNVISHSTTSSST